MAVRASAMLVVVICNELKVILSFLVGTGDLTPRVKAPLSGGPITPKAEALGYLEATAKTTTTTKANAGVLRFAQNDGLLEVASDLRVADDGFER